MEQLPLRSIPTPEGARSLAERVRREAGQPLEGFLDLRVLCQRVGVQVQVTELSAAQGGEEGLLVPLPSNRFGISVDPTPRGGGITAIPSSVRQDLLRHRARFRVAHELGHTFFYKRGANTTPRRSLFDSPEQEAFCDRFSRNLLAPPRHAARVRATARGVLEFQADCDVSLEVAARAVAEAQPHLRVSLWRRDAGGEVQLQWANRGGQRRGSSPPEDGLWLEDRGQLLSVA